MLHPATLERIQAIPPGGNRFDLPPALQLACHIKLGRASAKAPYGRIHADKPAPTMTTRCTTPACGTFVHPFENRGITLREASLLQTFPIDYVFKGSYQSIENQIGNAVPVNLAAALGWAAVAMLDPGDGT
jgi:DNA (cytosine-5)-methyltransferase 1